MQYAKQVLPMKKLLIFPSLALVLLGCGGGSSGGAGSSINLSGTFILQAALEGTGAISGTVNLSQDGAAVTGEFTVDAPRSGSGCIGSGAVSGSVSGNTAFLEILAEGGTLTGQLSGTSAETSGTAEAVFDGTICTGTATGQMFLARL